MKKILGLLLVSLLSVPALADGLKITSFVIVNGTVQADLCGSMSPAPKAPTFVQVTVDPKYKTEAHYNTVVGSDGNFCITVTTYSGQATLGLLK